MHILQNLSVLNSMRELKGQSSLRLSAHTSSGLQGSFWRRRSLVADLMLTALIDAFSILLIFLLMNFSNNLDEYQLSHIQGSTDRMPVAQNIDTLESREALTIRYRDGQYVIRNRLLNRLKLVESLRKELLENSRQVKSQLLIEAERETSYRELQPILSAASQLGFKKVELAVVQK